MNSEWRGNPELETEKTDEDVLFRFKSKESDIELTILTASESSFEHADDLEPLVSGWGNQIFVAFNGSVVERMMTEAIEKNGEQYGEKEAAFLVLMKIMKIAMQRADIYKEKINCKEIINDGWE